MDLSDLNLALNPFPPSLGTPTERLINIWADRKEIKEQLEDIIKASITNRSTEIILLHGDVGSGKTHTIKYFKNVIENDELFEEDETKPRVISFYIPNPGRRFLDLYRRFIVEVGRDRLVDFANDYAGFVYETFLKRLLRRVEDGDIRREELPMFFLDEFIKSEIRDILKLKVENFPNFGMVLLELRDKTLEDLAWSWLIGQKLYAADIRLLQVRGEIDSDENALRAFSALIQILIDVGYEEIFIFIDEVEAMIGVESRETIRYSESLRNLVDEHPDGIFLLFACTEAQWSDLLERFVPAFLSRAPNRNRLELGDIEEDEAIELIMDYLDSARIETPNTTEERLRPFTEDAIEEIRVKSNNKLRTILQNARYLIDAAITEDEGSITVDFVNEHIS